MTRSWYSQLINLLAMLLLISNNAFANSSKSNNSNNDEQIIRDKAHEFSKAFAAGDSQSIANMWSVDGKLTDETGKQYHGRDEIEKVYKLFFKQYGGQPMQVSIESITFPSGDVAIEEGVSRLISFPKGTMSRYTAVHQKKNGQWQMVNVTETPCRPATQPSVANNLKDLSWLIGDWTASGPDTKLHFKANWTVNNNFIRCTYETQNKDGNKITEEQIIGWNPLLGKIESWNFDASGGFGRGYWIQKDKSWKVTAAGVSSGGALSRATYVIGVLNNDKFSWQSINRTVDGKKLPDLSSIEIVRDKQ